MAKPQSRQKRLWIILAGLMTLALLMIFLYPIGYDTEITSYRVWTLVNFWWNYPLDLITYLLPFAGIVYLTLVIPKDKIMKRIRYIIAVLTVIIVCLIVVRRIHSVYVTKDWRYEYLKVAEPESVNKYATGYNVLDFIMGR